MPTDAENLATAVSNISALIADLTENPKPTYSINGQSVSWGDYLASLIKARNDLIGQIAIEEGPAAYLTQAVS